jgi:hypothetical protein
MKIYSFKRRGVVKMAEFKSLSDLTAIHILNSLADLRENNLEEFYKAIEIIKQLEIEE